MQLLKETNQVVLNVDQYKINWFWGLMTAYSVKDKAEHSINCSRTLKDHIIHLNPWLLACRRNKYHFDKLALALSGLPRPPSGNFALITVTLLFQNGKT